MANVLLLVLPVFSSCEIQNPDVLWQAALERKLTGPVIVVPCLGTAVDSSDLIRDALEAAVPGETVQLEAGTCSR